MKELCNSLIAWSFGLLLIFFIFSAARVGIADVLFHQAGSELLTAAQQGAEAERPDLSKADRLLDGALWLAPDNPELHEYYSRMVLWRATVPGVDVASRKALLDTGLEHIHRALALRPLYPYDWGVLLQLKYELHEYDAEFRRALRNTVELGGWEPSLQARVVNIGFGAWTDLPTVEQQLVMSCFARGMKRQSETMIDIARAHVGQGNGRGQDPASKP